MVTTRGRARHPAPESDDSSDDASIPAQQGRRRSTPPIGIPATLRPSKTPSVNKPNSTKRKRGPDVASDTPQHKRRRQGAEDEDTIEVQGEDDIVDAAINATDTRRKSRIEVQLPSSRTLRRHDETASTRVPAEDPTTAATGRLRARRLGRHINSVEVLGKHGISPRKRRHGNAVRAPVREAPEPESDAHSAGDGSHARQEEEVIAGAESPEPMGSPELQSSARKPRPTKRPTDIYDVPDDEESEHPSPVAPQRQRTINGLELSSRARASGNSARQRRPQRDGGRLSSIREEEQPQPARPASRSDSARQAAAPGVAPGDYSLVIHNEDRISPENEESAAQESDESAAQESDEELEEPEEIEDTDSDSEVEFIVIAERVRPYMEDERTISVFGNHLNSMSQLMGKSGWTGVGGTWRAHLSRFADTDFGNRLPTHTRLGGKLFTSLTHLKDQLDKVPNALHLAGQSRFVEAQHGALNQALSGVDRAVRRIEGLTGAGFPSQGNQAQARYIESLNEDLMASVIPMMVLVLRVSFTIGAEEPDSVVSDSVPADGVFTGITVQYLMVILGWLRRLLRVLTPELTQEPGENAGLHDDQQRDPENAEQNRRKFGVMVRKWIQQLRNAVDNFNEQVEREEEQQRMKRRDAAIRAQREREEAEQLARDRSQVDEWVSSMHSLNNRPGPLAQKSLRAMSLVRFAAPPSRLQTGTQLSAFNSGTQRSSSSGSSRRLPPPGAAQQLPPPPRAAPQAQPALPPLDLDYAPWPEDDVVWLLREINRPGRTSDDLAVWAEVLGRSEKEVTTEMERLRRLGRYRPPAPR